MYRFFGLLALFYSISCVHAHLNIADADQLRKDIKDFFSERPTEGWMFLNYMEKDTVYYSASGDGTSAELCESLIDDQIQYALIRLPLDNGKSIDIFINWIGPKVPPLEKELKAQHLKDVMNFLQPFHVHMTTSSRAEITDDLLKALGD